MPERCGNGAAAGVEESAGGTFVRAPQEQCLVLNEHGHVRFGGCGACGADHVLVTGVRTGACLDSAGALVLCAAVGTSATRPQEVRRLGLWGVCTDPGFQAESVCIACPKAPGKGLSVGEGGASVPLLAPWHPSHAAAGQLPHSQSFPRQAGGLVPPQQQCPCPSNTYKRKHGPCWHPPSLCTHVIWGPSGATPIPPLPAYHLLEPSPPSLAVLVVVGLPRRVHYAFGCVCAYVYVTPRCSLMERDDLGEPKLQWAQSTSCWLCTVSVLPPVR